MTIINKTMWQHKKPLTWNVQWKKKETKLCICIVWLKLKQIHDLLTGPAPAYSWTSFPVTLPLAQFSVTILTWLMLKTSQSCCHFQRLHTGCSLCLQCFSCIGLQGLPHLLQGGLPWTSQWNSNVSTWHFLSSFFVVFSPLYLSSPNRHFILLVYLFIVFLPPTGK